MAVHASATVDSAARVHPEAQVLPGSWVGPEVEVGPGCVVGPNAVIEGPTSLGPDNRVHPFAALGGPPQDLGYRGEPTRLEIGRGNTFREGCTVHRASTKQEGVTRVGSGCYLMAWSHVAHDCRLGDGVVLANGATLAGHVQVDDQAIVSGLVAIHQFVRVGRLAFLAGGAMVERDVPPFCRAAGDRAVVVGLNAVGLRRSGVDAAGLRRLKAAYQRLWESDCLEAALAALGEGEADPLLIEVVRFYRERGERGILRPGPRNGRSDGGG